MKLNDLPEKWRQQAFAQIDPSFCPSKQKLGGELALDKKGKVQEIHAPCLIRYTVFKVGSNWDIDNREIKSVQDGLVEAGVLKDDTIKEVPRITKEGVRVKSREEEKTVIELWEI